MKQYTSAVQPGDRVFYCGYLWAVEAVSVRQGRGMCAYISSYGFNQHWVDIDQRFIAHVWR